MITRTHMSLWLCACDEQGIAPKLSHRRGSRVTLWLLRPVITHPPGILAKTSVTLLGGQLGHVGVKSVRRRSLSSHKDSRATLGWFMFWRTGCHWPREAEPVLQCPVKASHQPTGRRSCLIPSQALDYDPVESGHHKFKNQTKPNQT